MNKYFHIINNSIYSNPDLLAHLFNGIEEEINFLIINNKCVGDIDVQNFTYNVYFIPKKEENYYTNNKNTNNINNIAVKIFITFHPKKTLLGKEKYVLTINTSINQNFFSDKIYKKIIAIIKKRVKKIKELPEFKGMIKSIKI